MRSAISTTLCDVDVGEKVARMKNCAKCGKELKKVLLLGHVASKSFLRKEGYDGADWSEPYENVKRFGFPFLPEPHIVTYERYGYPPVEYVEFCLCFKCTPKDFDFVGQVEETEIG